MKVVRQGGFLPAGTGHAVLAVYFHLFQLDHAYRIIGGQHKIDPRHPDGILPIRLVPVKNIYDDALNERLVVINVSEYVLGGVLA